MPIQKTITTPSGSTASFHIIANIEVGFLNGSASVSIRNFANQAAQNAGASQVDFLTVDVSGIFESIPAAEVLQSQIEHFLIAQPDGILAGGTQIV